MKSKFQTALKSNVDPFFFVLTCVILMSVSMTAKVLADDVLTCISGPTEDLLMTQDGQLFWTE